MKIQDLGSLVRKLKTHRESCLRPGGCCDAQLAGIAPRAYVELLELEKVLSGLAPHAGLDLAHAMRPAWIRDPLTDPQARELQAWALDLESRVLLLSARVRDLAEQVQAPKPEPERVPIVSPPAEVDCTVDLEGLQRAVGDVCAERLRQITVKGWSYEHDDAHEDGELAVAAACYAHHASSAGNVSVEVPDAWPWAIGQWRPESRRSDLVRAGALIIAELERLDRLKPPFNPDDIQVTADAADPSRLVVSVKVPPGHPLAEMLSAHDLDQVELADLASNPGPAFAAHRNEPPVTRFTPGACPRCCAYVLTPEGLCPKCGVIEAVPGVDQPTAETGGALDRALRAEARVAAANRDTPPFAAQPTQPPVERPLSPEALDQAARAAGLEVREQAAVRFRDPWGRTAHAPLLPPIDLERPSEAEQVELADLDGAAVQFRAVLLAAGDKDPANRGNETGGYVHDPWQWAYGHARDWRAARTRVLRAMGVIR